MLNTYLDNKGFADFIEIFSHNALFNFVDSVRNTGKTTKAKIVALKRFLKKGKKTIWVRTFENDVKQSKKDFYNKKIIKMLNDDGYNVALNQITVDGSYIVFTDEKGHKNWFVKLVYLANAQSLKGNEIVDADFIVYDEYRTKSNRIARYIGNQTKDFIDILVTIARDHEVKCLFLGNKECFNNPFYDYLKIKPPKEDFEGIKKYKHGSILICQINTVPSSIAQNETNTKLKYALEGTPSLGYLFNGKTEGIDYTQIKKPPKTLIYYCGFNIKNSVFGLQFDTIGNAYFTDKIDKLQHVYSDCQNNSYKYCERLLKGDKKHFKLLIKAIKNNCVWFESVGTAERVQYLFNFLGIK